MKTRVLASIAILALAHPAVAETDKSDGPYIYTPSASGTCVQTGDADLCIPLDGSWDVVTFSSDSDCSGEVDTSDPCQRNDDDHSFGLPLGFTFDLYGTPYSSVFINNNGNVSFGQGFCTFTAEPFPFPDFPMVAPFWGDVDTQSSPANGSGVVWTKQGPNYFAVTWDHVGYYDENDDLQNTFQLIISDGTYDPVGLGNNFCFCFGDMQWTTGDASEGVGGFGGEPATVGVNRGDGIDFFAIGRFDHPGSDYDGPGGAADGVDWLDGKTLCANVSGDVNIPPVAIDLPSECVSVDVGETVEVVIGFIGPEGDQSVSVAVSDGGLLNFNAVVVAGNPATVTMTLTPLVDQVGDHTITLTATDDGVPAAETVVDVTFCVGNPVPILERNWSGMKHEFRTPGE